MTVVLATMFTLLATVLLANLIHLRQARWRLGGRPTPKSRVSIIIPARDEARNLERLIPTLLMQSHHEFEIIIYDDDSADDTLRFLSRVNDSRVKVIHGLPLPPGWVGKVHALYQATRTATGDLYLFLDADAALRDGQSLERLAARFEGLTPDSVLTGITRMSGGGQLLVSLLPFVILTCLPLPLAERLRSRRLTGLNGQCWMIQRSLYHQLEPHLQHPAEVLEDIHIGRYLKANNVVPHLLDLQEEVEVFMYRDLAGAWRGFRKNVYPFMGESVWSFAAIHILYVTILVASPLISPWFLVASYGLKLITDRFASVPLFISIATPVTMLLGALLQLDSAVAHWSGRAVWKDRPIARRHLAHADRPRGVADSAEPSRQD